MSKSCTLVAAASLCLGLASAPAAFGQTPDCAGPAGDPQPSTPEWDQRDQDNQYCAEERHADHAQHPVLAPVAPNDQYRAPGRHDGVRFRYELVAITSRDDDLIEAEIYAPCKAGSCPNLPAELRTFEPPYPGVVIIHGGGSRKELHWWSSQPLAEAGYLVVVLDTVSSLSGHQPDSEDVIDWFFATPTSPTAHGEFNPFWQEFDGEPIGIAGHSAGGVAVNAIGHEDPRVGAVASWDRAQSSPIPPDREVRTPTVFFMADYNCQQVPFCQPEDYPEPPSPDGPGNKGGDYFVLQNAGVDTMQIPLRAALHLDWTPSALAGNRYAELVNMYYKHDGLVRPLRARGRRAGQRAQRLPAPDGARLRRVRRRPPDQPGALRSGAGGGRRRSLRGKRALLDRGHAGGRPVLVLLPGQVRPLGTRDDRPGGVR